MDKISQKVRDKIKEDKEYKPKHKERRLENGNRFSYHYGYRQYVLRNRCGVLLRLFDRDTIDNMSEDEFVDLLVTCSKDNR